MAQDFTGRLPNFNSSNDVRTYLIENRHHLNMIKITDASDWAMDPGFIQRDAIAQFILTLPRAQQHQLDDERCLLCLSPYDTVSDAHFPIVMPCGHIVGAACLSESLEDSESCPYCRATIFTRPAAAPHLANPSSETILRGLLQSGRAFLEETMLSSQSEKSYAAFYRWAHGHSIDSETVIFHALAREINRQLESSVRS